jgi:hypothetical protein
LPIDGRGEQGQRGDDPGDGQPPRAEQRHQQAQYCEGAADGAGHDGEHAGKFENDPGHQDLLAGHLGAERGVQERGHAIKDSHEGL